MSASSTNTTKALDLSQQYINYFAPSEEELAAAAVDTKPDSQLRAALEACADKYSTKETWGAWLWQGVEMVGEFFLSIFGKSTKQEALTLLTNHQVNKIQSKGGQAVVSEQEGHAEAILNLVVDLRGKKVAAIDPAEFTQKMELVEKATGLFNRKLTELNALIEGGALAAPSTLNHLEGEFLEASKLFVGAIVANLPGHTKEWTAHVRASMQHVFDKAVAPILKHHKMAPGISKMALEHIAAIEKKWAEFLNPKPATVAAEAPVDPVKRAATQRLIKQARTEAAAALAPAQGAATGETAVTSAGGTVAKPASAPAPAQGATKGTTTTASVHAVQPATQATVSYAQLKSIIDSAEEEAVRTKASLDGKRMAISQLAGIGFAAAKAK